MTAHLRLIAGFSVFGFVMVALLLWGDIAIMPDEIAIRVQTGRFIQDAGMSYGLYGLCPDRFQPVPWIFIPSAWVLSWVDLHLSAIQFRSIQLAVLLGCFAVVTVLSTRSKNPSILLWIPAAMVGVSGSTLVYYRYEVFIYLHLLFGCLALYSFSVHQSRLARFVLAMGLIFSQLTMAYTHPQAQLFVPLTAYLTYRLIFGTRLQAVGLVIIALIFSGIAATTHVFFDLHCASQPGIAAFWKQMVVDGASFDFGAIMSASSEKFDILVKTFTYNTDYKMHYLLGLPSTVVDTPMIAFINNGIRFGLLLVAFTGVTLFLISLVRILIFAIQHKMDMRKWHYDPELFFICIFGPIAFYYWYDNNLYFYRAHFLNAMAVLAIVIGASTIQLHLLVQRTIAVLGVLLVAIAVMSVVTNAAYFSPTLLNHEGPSTSISNEVLASPSKIEGFANACGIDVANGNAIVSDVTYEIAKRYKKIHAITYLGLQMSLAHVSAAEVIRAIRPNYVLARCTEMEMTGLGWPADKTMGLLCCSRVGAEHDAR
jgi:hypothetical protein